MEQLVKPAKLARLPVASGGRNDLLVGSNALAVLRLAASLDGLEREHLLAESPRASGDGGGHERLASAGIGSSYEQSPRFHVERDRVCSIAAVVARSRSAISLLEIVSG